MAKESKTVGLNIHSNFARRYAAIRRENPLGHAEETGAKLDHALGLQAAHWGAIGERLYGGRGEVE